MVRGRIVYGPPSEADVRSGGREPPRILQWFAPLASESPELIAVAYLLNNARSTAGFNALICSKLNQWTLLIGTLAIVHSISAGAIGTLPLDSKQAAEIWFTAGQCLFAIAILFTAGEAVTLLVLFGTQVLAELYIIRIYTDPVATNISTTVLYAYTAIYPLLGLGLFVRRREGVRTLVGRTVSIARSALGTSGADAPREPLSREYCHPDRIA